jgi:trigger factor
MMNLVRGRQSYANIRLVAIACRVSLATEKVKCAPGSDPRQRLPNGSTGVTEGVDIRAIPKPVQLDQDEAELATFKDNDEKINELRESVTEMATNSVKATFLVDYLAKEEGVAVNDQEVSQTIYYEAMMSGQDPQEVIKYYQENNLLPAVKMGMIEDKLFAKIIGIDQ